MNVKKVAACHGVWFYIVLIGLYLVLQWFIPVLHPQFDALDSPLPASTCVCHPQTPPVFQILPCSST